MTNLKDELKSKLSKEEIKIMPSSFDVIGSIAIFNDFPEKLKRREKLIAETLMKLNKNIKTVAKKTKKYSGKFRLAKIKVMSGKKTKETIHKENGVFLKLDVGEQLEKKSKKMRKLLKNSKIRRKKL